MALLPQIPQNWEGSGNLMGRVFSENPTLFFWKWWPFFLVKMGVLSGAKMGPKKWSLATIFLSFYIFLYFSFFDILLFLFFLYFCQYYNISILWLLNHRFLKLRRIYSNFFFCLTSFVFHHLNLMAGCARIMDPLR